MRISNRLRTLATQLIPGLPVHDLACDHGQLGIHAYLLGLYPKIIFSDSNPVAIAALKEKFKAQSMHKNLTAELEFYACDAHEFPIHLTGNVVIAGLGGKLMHSILTSLHACDKLHADRLILSPHKHFDLFENVFLFDYQKVKQQELFDSGCAKQFFVYDRHS